MNFFGRRQILTSCLPKSLQPREYLGETLDDTTVAREVNEALLVHRKNEEECRALFRIYRGNHDILRRPRGNRIVNNRVVLDYPLAFTRNITGYTYSGGIRYVPTEDKYAEPVRLLNNFMRCENKHVFDKTMADNQSITGTSYLSIFPDEMEKNGVPFELSDLSPEHAFVAYSTVNKNIPVFSWNVFPVTTNGVRYWAHQVYSRDRKWLFKSRSRYTVRTEDLLHASSHILGDVPIIEYPNNQFRLGDWECAVSVFNALNNLASDGINDVEQTVLSYLALFGVDLEAEDLEDMRKNRILVFKGAAGINQDAKFITAQLDGNSAQLLRAYLEQALKCIVGIPDRDVGQSGSDTGLSAQVRTGSNDMEIVARNKTIFTSMSERRLLRIALNILTPQHIKDLQVENVDIDIPRNKLTDIVSKTQAGSTAYAMGIAKTDVARIMDVTNDIIGFCDRWEKNESRKAAAQTEAQTVETPLEDTETENKEEPNDTRSTFGRRVPGGDDRRGDRSGAR